MSNSLMNTPSAMAIASTIDDMRHEHLSLEGYLGLYQDRKALSANFADFYARTGITGVTPEMIDKAVESYKKDRFTFKGWKGSSLGLSIARAYLWFYPRRVVVTLSTALGALCVIGMVIGTEAVKNHLEASHRADAVASINTDVANFEKSLAGLNKEISDHKNWLNSFTRNSTSGADLLHTQLQAVGDQLVVLGQLRDDITAWSKSALVLDTPAIEKDPVAQKIVWDARINGRMGDFKQDLQKARAEMARRVADVESLKSTSERLAQIRASALYASYASEPDVAFKLTRAEMDFSQGRVEEARVGVDQLNQLLQSRQNSRQLLANYETLSTQVRPIFKDDAGKARLNKLMAQAQLAAQQGNKAGYTAISEQVSNLADFVATPIHMEIVNAKGVKSGLEREYKENGSAKNVAGPKRWYLIVQAVDATGKKREMDIFNIETQKTERVTMWGQEVSRKGYEAVKQDKVADGILDDTDVGDKPSGSYEFNYTMPMLNGTITRWEEKANGQR